MIPGSPPLLPGEAHDDGPGPSKRKTSFAYWFNRHPDRYGVGAVEDQSLPDMKIINSRTKGRVRLATIAQSTLRVLSLISALTLLVCVILITHTSGAIAYIIRVGPIVSIIHCSYALWFHLRKKARNPSSSASYMIFAGIFDLVLNGFFAFSAYVAYEEWSRNERDWKTMLTNQNAKKVIVPLTFVANCVTGGLHLLSLVPDIYLLVIYVKISKLPPSLNPLERETLTTRPKKRNRLSDWRVRHSKHFSDATLIGEPSSPTKSKIGFPTSPTKNGMAVNQVPFSDTRQFIRDTSSRYSRPTAENADSPIGYQQSTQPHYKIKRKPVRGRSRSRSRPDTAHSDATLRYSGDEDEQSSSSQPQEPNPSTTAIYEVSMNAADGDWYHTIDEPEIAENSGTVVHHKLGSGNHKSRRPYGQDHVYVYCGIDEGLQEEEDEDEEDPAHQAMETHALRMGSGVNHAYTQVDTYADDMNNDQDALEAASRTGSATKALYGAVAPTQLSHAQLLNVPYKEEISFPPLEEIDSNYNPLTGSIRTNVSFPRLTLPPNQPRGLTPTSKNRFYAQPEIRQELEMIVQSPTEANTPATPTTPGAWWSDEKDGDDIHTKRSFWNLGKSKKKIKYDALRDIGDSDGPTPSTAISGPSPTGNGDREGRVVSNSSVERFEGEYLPPCNSNPPVVSFNGNGSTTDAQESGPKQRNVSGKKTGEEQRDTAAAECHSPSKTRVARELLAPGQYRAAGWARFSGL
ncbi:hypothetical protein KEM56_000799 [Ascosphaera pollenicola]|nr:hypothetical protein KEM56_000799 [Ascosphaera pollenicola]